MNKGFRAPPNMEGLMRQAQKLQQEIQRVQLETQALVAEASSGGGMVKAVVNGKHELVSLKISPDVVNREEIDLLQDMIRAAVNEAHTKVVQAADQELSKVTAGMNIPGIG
jgi:DNA-binding YbaB/EbfC family protein